MMPVMDGFEFMRRLRADETGSGIPVIVLTAKTLSPEEEAFLQSTTRRVIQKGSDEQDELTGYLRTILDSQPDTPDPKGDSD